MRLPVINRMMFIFKFHYFFFQAGIGPTQTAMPVYAQTLGFSSFVVGTIYTILPLLGLLIKPACGALADRFKWHKGVMLASEIIIMLSYFSVQFIPSGFTPSPAHNSSSAIQMFCGADSAEFSCRGEDTATPYFFAESQGNSTCHGKCFMEPQIWTNFCNNDKFLDKCTLSQIGQENCIKIPKDNFVDVSSAFCEEIQKNSTKCVRKCFASIKETDVDDSDDEEGEYQDDSITFKQYQFYIFVILMVGSFAGTAVTTTLSDTICISKSPDDPSAYGKQRLWGSLGYGVLSIISGLLVDAISVSGEPKNYAPAYYLSLGVLLFDIILTYFYMDVEIPQQSENIAKDVWKMLLNVRVFVFLVWCAAMGVSMGLTWTFLYWLLEDLAKATGPETVDSIKTIEGLTNGCQTFLGETPAFFFAGWVLTKIGHGHTMSVILLTIGIRFTIYSFLSNPWFVLIVEPLQLYYGLFYSTMTSYANIVAPPGTEATVQSIMCAVCEGIGVAIGSFLGGFFYDAYGGLICFRIFGISFLVMAVINETIEFIYRIKDKKNSVAPT